MDLKTIHFNITTFFHSFFYGPNFLSLIHKLDGLKLNDYIKFIILNIIKNKFENNYFLHDTIYSKINLIETKTNHIDILFNVIDDMFNYIVLNSIQSNILQNFNYIHKFIQYYIYGFFYNEYKSKYEVFVNKLKIINTEIEYLSTDINNDITNLLDKKKEIYELLIIDFSLELFVSYFDIHVSNYMNILGISELNNISNVNFNELFKDILNKIDDSIKLLNEHNEKIKILNS